MKKDLILIGSGGHALSCIDVIEEEGIFKIAGLVGLTEQVGNQPFKYPNYSVLGEDVDLVDLFQRYNYAFIAIGQIKTSEPRVKAYHELLRLGYNLPTIISPRSIVSKYASIGSGTIVMNGAIVNAGACIGNNCIINSGALIEHGVHIEDHCHISTGVILNGDVRVGENTFIGSSSVVKQGVFIGKYSVVGMGLSIKSDLIDYTDNIGISKSE